MSRNSVSAHRARASLAAAMSARAHAHLAASSLLYVLLTFHICCSENVKCGPDGLYVDFESGCREYVRCAGGAMRARYACPAPRVFSEAAGACVEPHRAPCVRRRCAPQDTLAYAAPGTACRHYYRCENGTALERACPPGSWFDIALQACAHGAGTCYEPVCAGLSDGTYPDPSHECRRALQCRGAELVGVGPCNVPACGSPCPAPRSAAVALPAGDADFCSDEACTSLCHEAADGVYADRAAGCREYFACEARRVTRRGVCEPGQVFAAGACVAAGSAACPPPALSPCFNRGDGLHRDWRNCAAWFECRRERVIARGTCGAGLVFDGATCLSRDRFPCEGPERAPECEGRPSGTYQDLKSNCTRYYRCEGLLRTRLACPAGSVYDGARCTPVSEYLCPSLEGDTCYGREDGRYRALDAGCRGYYACINGEKAIYACAAGSAFDGERCVPARSLPGLCPGNDRSCTSLADGYHPEKESGCRRYFYCEGGDRLATLSCSGGKIFDGQACVEAASHACGTNRAIEAGAVAGVGCKHDGFFVQAGSGCRRYYFCVQGVRTTLACPSGRLFNGQVCVSRDLYTCPTG